MPRMFSALKSDGSCCLIYRTTSRNSSTSLHVLTYALWARKDLMTLRRRSLPWQSNFLDRFGRITTKQDIFIVCPPAGNNRTRILNLNSFCHRNNNAIWEIFFLLFLKFLQTRDLEMFSTREKNCFRFSYWNNFSSICFHKWWWWKGSHETDRSIELW